MTAATQCCRQAAALAFGLPTAGLGSVVVGTGSDIAGTRAPGVSGRARGALVAGSAALRVRGSAFCSAPRSVGRRRITGRTIVGTRLALAGLGQSARCRKRQNAQSCHHQFFIVTSFNRYIL